MTYPAPALPVTAPVPAIDPRIKAAAIALFVAAGVTLIGAFTKTWFSMRHESGGVGLLGIEECMSRSCRSMMWFDIKRAPADIGLLGLVGLGAAGAAIGLAIHTAAMLLRGTAEQAKVHALVPAIAIAGFAAVAFFLRLELGEPGHKLSISWGFFACLAGLGGLAVITAARVRPLARAAQATYVPAMYAPQMPPPQMAMPQTPAPPVGMPQMGAPQLAPMVPYPLTLQLGMTRFYGNVFLAPGRLFFVCTKEGGAWLAAIGQGLGGALGGALMAAAMPTPGSAPTVMDPEVLVRAVHDHPGSLILEAQQITEIKQTMFWRLIRWNGKKFGLPRGLGRELKPAIAAWARYHAVKTTGFS